MSTEASLSPTGSWFPGSTPAARGFYGAAGGSAFADVCRRRRVADRELVAEVHRQGPVRAWGQLSKPGLFHYCVWDGQPLQRPWLDLDCT